MFLQAILSSRGVIFRLRISPRIRSQSWNGSQHSVRDLCRTGLCKYPRKFASLPCTFNFHMLNFSDIIFHLQCLDSYRKKTFSAAAVQTVNLILRCYTYIIAWLYPGTGASPRCRQWGTLPSTAIQAWPLLARPHPRSGTALLKGVVAEILTKFSFFVNKQITKFQKNLMKENPCTRIYYFGDHLEFSQKCR